MLKKINVTELIAAVQKVIKESTNKDCYDFVPDNASSPFYFVEFAGRQPVNSKTMFREKITVYVHSISEPSNSSVQIYGLLNDLEEAMTQNIALSEDYNLINQIDNGVLNIKTDETDEKHAVSSYTFDISYGYKVKV